MDSNRIGRNIAALRKRDKITQQQLAQALSVSTQAVSKWERGSGCPDRHGSALQQSAPQYTHDLPLR